MVSVAGSFIPIRPPSRDCTRSRDRLTAASRCPATLRQRRPRRDDVVRRSCWSRHSRPDDVRPLNRDRTGAEYLDRRRGRCGVLMRCDCPRAASSYRATANGGANSCSGRTRDGLRVDHGSLISSRSCVDENILDRFKGGSDGSGPDAPPGSLDATGGVWTGTMFPCGTGLVHLGCGTGRSADA